MNVNIPEMPKHNKGSLLLEALLSIVILSVSVTVVIQSMASSLRAAVYSVDYTKALFLLEDTMFGLMQEGFITPGISEERTYPAPNEKFRYVLKTEPNDEPGQENINKVELSVLWETKRRESAIKLETYILNAKQE